MAVGKWENVGKSGFEPWPGLCAVFSGKTFYSHGASLHPGVQMGTNKLSGKPDKVLRRGGAGRNLR